MGSHHLRPCCSLLLINLKATPFCTKTQHAFVTTGGGSLAPCWWHSGVSAPGYLLVGAHNLHWHAGGNEGWKGEGTRCTVPPHQSCFAFFASRRCHLAFMWIHHALQVYCTTPFCFLPFSLLPSCLLCRRYHALELRRTRCFVHGTASLKCTLMCSIVFASLQAYNCACNFASVQVSKCVSIHLGVQVQANRFSNEQVNKCAKKRICKC